MAVIAHTDKEVDLLARLMRAEAEAEGNLGMLMVGNVGVNRVIEDCLDFGGIRNIQDMVYQSHGGFEAFQHGYFYQRPREHDRRLARRVLRGERFHPAERSLWFFMPQGACPAQWYGQWNSGRHKSHYFFSPLPSVCQRL